MSVCVCVCFLGPAATNIFIHGNEEQGQLANEVRFLWGQNQALKEQLNSGSRGKTNTFSQADFGSISVRFTFFIQKTNTEKQYFFPDT